MSFCMDSTSILNQTPFIPLRSPFFASYAIHLHTHSQPSGMGTSMGVKYEHPHQIGSGAST